MGGAIGTWAGGTILGGGAIGLFALFGLCLGPFGIFITVFIFASAGGIIGNEFFRWSSGRIYDAGSRISNRIYLSAEDFVGTLYE